MTEDDAARFAANGELMIDNVAAFIQGKRDVITLAVTCLLAEGHLLESIRVAGGTFATGPDKD
jgi:hypothetical protein